MMDKKINIFLLSTRPSIRLAGQVFMPGKINQFPPIGGYITYRRLYIPGKGCQIDTDETSPAFAGKPFHAVLRQKHYKILPRSYRGFLHLYKITFSLLLRNRSVNPKLAKYLIIS
jgi:hypothetical protein